MSYDLYLVDPVSGDTLHAPAKHCIQGGTYAAGGTTELRLHATYNYADIFVRVLGPRGVRELHGKTGAEVLPALVLAAKSLSNNTDPDYWKSTEGNVKRLLLQLVALSQIRPDGVWSGD